MILSLTAGLAACGGSAGEGSQDEAKDAGVQRYAWPLGSSSPEDTVTQYMQRNLPMKWTD